MYSGGGQYSGLRLDFLLIAGMAYFPKPHSHIVHDYWQFSHLRATEVRAKFEQLSQIPQSPHSYLSYAFVFILFISCVFLSSDIRSVLRKR